MDANLHDQKPIQQKSPIELLVAQTSSLLQLVEIQNTQSVQIAKLKSQNEKVIELLSKQHTTLGTDTIHVKIEDINMPFSALVGFMIKIAIASIPAGIIIGILYAIVVALFGGILASCS